MRIRPPLLLLFLLPSMVVAEEGKPRVYLEGGAWLSGEVENPVSAEDRSGEWKRPFGVAFDPQGTAWLVEYDGGRLWRRPAGGTWEVFAGSAEEGYSGDGGPVGEAKFRKMHNVVVDGAGNLYISDTSNHCVRKVERSTGVISTIAGTGKAGFRGDGGPGTRAQFNLAICVMLDSTGERLHVADIGNKRIREVDLKTGWVRTVAGNGRAGVPEDGQSAVESPLVDPRAAVADAEGNLYILERGGHALRVVDREGRIRTIVGDGKAGNRDGAGRQARLNAPKHLCLDARGRVLIADDGNHAVRRYDPKTDQLETVLGGGRGAPPVTLRRPHGVTVHNGIIYVVDSYHERLLRVEE